MVRAKRELALILQDSAGMFAFVYNLGRGALRVKQHGMRCSGAALGRLGQATTAGHGGSPGGCIEAKGGYAWK